MAIRKCGRNVRRAVTIVAVVVMLPVFLGFVALAVDVGYLCSINAELQRTGDAAALAAAGDLPVESEVRTIAEDFGELNELGHGMVLANTDITVGTWDLASRIFHANMEPYDAVQLTIRRATANANPVELFFAKLLGVAKSDLSATAVAYRPMIGFRFLIDDEMFDTDEPTIQALAASLGKTADDLLKDDDDDFFIDIPPGSIINLPTGQVGDEALFDVQWADFPFTATSGPSMLDFLLYNTTGDDYGIDDDDLDPLVGVEPVSDPDLYDQFIKPWLTHVSPVYKSDVSNTTPGVNAKGERRGLVAFKIIELGVDPPGSYLPHLIIEIADPAEIDLNTIAAFTSNKGGNLMLVK